MGSHALGHEQHQGREPASGTHPACGNRLDRVDVPPDESHLPGSSVRLRVAPPPPPRERVRPAAVGCTLIMRDLCHCGCWVYRKGCLTYSSRCNPGCIWTQLPQCGDRNLVNCAGAAPPGGGLRDFVATWSRRHWSPPGTPGEYSRSVGSSRGQGR